jgi:hypothetical protein
VNVRFYMDVHVRRAVTDGLRLRKVDVLTAQDDEAAELDDPELLDRATELRRILFLKMITSCVKQSGASRAVSYFPGSFGHLCSPTKHHYWSMYF